MHWTVGALCWVAVALTLAFAVCRLLGPWTRATSWLKCTKEEKADLTRSGIYDANGFLMKPDSDETIPFPMATMSRADPPLRRDSSIPPQPLRPAPVTVPIPKYTTAEVVKEVDPTTRNNLNIFKKPEYTNTNPFLTDERPNGLNGRFNPFYSQYGRNALSDGDDESESERDSGENVQLDEFNIGPKRSARSDNESNVLDSSVRRAISCDSVSSDTSLGPLQSPLPTVTGQLCLSLRCYRINTNDSLLAVNVIEATNLREDTPDTYVEIFLLPDHKGGRFKTKTCHGTNCPSYNETFLVDLGKTNKNLCFHLYNTKNDACSLIGEAELSLQEASSYKRPVTTWLTLTDTGKGTVEFGELMLSLSYLPTAERLTLIITRARRLPDPSEYNVFFKVYLQRGGKKVTKKRTSVKRSETVPTFNEAFIFSVPPTLLSSIALRVTLVYFPIGIDYQNLSEHQKVGHVVLCRDAPGKPGNHWNQMIASLRRPVSMWHTLRRPHI